MLFDCVQVNTGLGFHWICNSEKKGGYMWIDDVINLEPFFSFWPVGRFWLVKTYQFEWHSSVLSHHALGTVECDDHITSKGGPYLIVGVRGILLLWVILRREGRHDHIWISFFFVTSVPGCRVMPLYDIWAGSILIWGRHNATGFGGLKLITPYYLYVNYKLDISP
jgi:hypothetical protein